MEEYCAKTGVNRTEAISRGIGKLKEEDTIQQMVEGCDPSMSIQNPNAEGDT